MMTDKEIFDAIRQRVGPLTQDQVDSINAILHPKTGKITSEKGIALIKEFEGCRLTAYPDPATGGEPWTIGYGHTGGVRKGDVISQSQADIYLHNDLKRFEDAVTELCPVTTQNQFDALVSFTFNLGEGNLKSSTLRRMHNAGDYKSAKGQFIRWNKAAGKVMAGLTRRREAEAALYGSTS